MKKNSFVSGASLMLVLSLAVVSGAADSEPPLIPREVLFGNPDRMGVAVSPRHPDEILVGLNERNPQFHDL